MHNGGTQFACHDACDKFTQQEDRMGSTRTSAIKNSQKKLTVIRPQQPRFWGQLGIFPAALTEGDPSFNDFSTAKGLLRRIGRGNLGMLCEKFKIVADEDSDAAELTEKLLAQSDAMTILHLAEFMKRRIEPIENYFTTKHSETAFKKIQASVAQHSPRRPEKLKPFTRLLLLFNKRPAALLDIFAAENWRSHSTSFEYLLTSKDDFPKFANKNTAGIVKAFEKVTKFGVSKLCAHTLSDGRRIWIFLREYKPRVKRDYHHDYNVSHDCGMIIFGYDPADGHIHFKSGNKQLAFEFSDLIEKNFDSKLVHLKSLLFSDYKPDETASRFCGDYDESGGILLHEIEFSRTGLPGEAGVCLKRGFMQKSVKNAVQTLADESNGFLDVSGPADVARMLMEFDGKPATVELVRDKGGAFTFDFNNSGWEKEDQKAFEGCFQTTFGIPVNRLIDPTVAPMGNAAIIGSLLGQKNRATVLPYQEEMLDFLMEEKLLKCERHSFRCCTENFCPSNKKPITNEDQKRCTSCNATPGQSQSTLLTLGKSQLVKLAAKFFANSNFELDTTIRSFEGVKYYRLKQPDGDQSVLMALVIADRPTPTMRHAFERASLPLIVLQPTTGGKLAYVDLDNVGHLSAAHMIASRGETSLRRVVERSCHNVVNKMGLTHQEAIRKAARHSHSILTDGTEELNGNKYETEIFNLMRILLPYSFQLGRVGKEEPDGFVSIPDYKDIDGLSDVGSFNFSYDAKYSEEEKGYNFGSTERLQVINYIQSLSRKKHILGTRNGKYHAHLIVSNNIQNSKLAAAAKKLYGDDGLKGKAKDVRFGVMRQEFVIELYEWVQGQSLKVLQKRPYLYECIIKLLETNNSDRFVELGTAEAKQVIETVEKFETVEAKIERGELIKSLDDDKQLIS